MDYMDVDTDFEMKATEELRHLCINKFINNIYCCDRHDLELEAVRLFLFSVKESKKCDLIYYLFND